MKDWRETENQEKARGFPFCPFHGEVASRGGQVSDPCVNDHDWFEEGIQ